MNTPPSPGASVLAALPVLPLEPQSLAAMQAQLADIWARTLNVRRVGIDDDFFALGGDSLAAARIAVEAQAQFGVPFPPSELADTPTVARMAERLCFAFAQPHSLVPLQPSGSRLPLFLIPGADGEAIGYAKIRQHLGDNQPLYGLTARGHDGRAPHADVQTMARDYLAEIRRIQPRGPYHLLGMCIGGMVALEMAQQLLAAGEPVGLLALMDTHRRYNGRAGRARSHLRARAAYHLRRVRRLGVREALGYLRDRAISAPRAALEQGAALAAPERRSATEIAYFRAIRSYRPLPYGGALSLFVNETWAAAQARLGWQSSDAAVLTVRVVPGDHDSHLNAYLPQTVAQLRAALDGAFAAAPAPADQRVLVPAVPAARADASTIPALFEQIAAERPSVSAVESSGGAFTFDALNRAANRIARAIVARRGDGEEAVPLCFGRTTLVVAAMLGALKAGKFFVPLDTSDPEARSRLMIADAQARLILTDTASLPRARALAGENCDLLNVEMVDSGADDSNLNRAIASSRLAYLLYTSGSTGTPKGIAHTHYGFTKIVILRGRAGFYPPDERQVMLYSWSAISSTARIFGTLLNRGTICIYDLHAQGLYALAGWLRRERIHGFKTTPTVFRHFCATLEGRADLPDLRAVELNGEPVLVHDVALFKRHFAPPCRMRVDYGSSETLALTLNQLDHHTVLSGASVPVGYAMPYTRLHIWDSAGKPLPPGELGEIVGQSDTFATGYWRRPDLTAQAFLPDPDGGNARLYRTGDLGRMRADGLLEWCGRKDDQIKVRGHRVEPAEIEQALFALDGVQQASVAARAGTGGNPQLVAFLVSRDALPDAATLRAALGARLPAYMIPLAFVRVKAFPLTASGKVDHRALLAERDAPELLDSGAESAPA